MAQIPAGYSMLEPRRYACSGILSEHINMHLDLNLPASKLQPSYLHTPILSQPHHIYIHF